MLVGVSICCLTGSAMVNNGPDREEKIHTTTVETLLFFSGSEASMVYTILPRPMVYTLVPCLYTIAFLLCDLGVVRQTKRGWVPRWWCILFCPCHKRIRCPRWEKSLLNSLSGHLESQALWLNGASQVWTNNWAKFRT